ncbi:acyl-CoA dehydrogenase family protein [Oceanicoccus sp. KOV_DT_Chl]|uniref:acyl-CoA dehydrogenase family protein n=1 Tax=Oceanicoccus sp. KOV_DT_Chl TaxID=1904639 RepID=UPI000C7E405B|nr:acyl-CoA dehydrogenase family protein [Oceanicoccus sp. KOV_DT_Chl]
MDFGFNDEQKDVQNLARQILSEQVLPEKLAEYDEFKHERFDQALWQQLAEAGLLGVAVAEEYGGMGFGFTELALFIEEIGRSIAPVPVIPHLVSAASAIQHFGSAEQKQRLLPGAASGELILTAALMEMLNENAGAPLSVTATSAADGVVLNGVKTCVPFADHAERVLLSAATAKGVVVVLVDPKASGVSLTEVKVTTYEPQFELNLNNVTVAAADILVAEAEGSAAMQWISERTSAAICAHQLGVTDKSMRMTASYTAERQQFGVPIATFQAVGHRAANCFIDVESLRLNTYQAVSLLDSGRDATNEVHIAKIWAGDVGHRVSYASQHLHGVWALIAITPCGDYVYGRDTMK